jgi:hypothetical protein
MRAWIKKWWPVGKVILGLAVLFFIGRRFAEDLQEPGLWERHFHAGWMVISGGLYVLALGFSALFWYRLLRGFDQQPTLAAAFRAYYIGHLGKYTPGKAFALVMRAALVAGPRVGAGRAGLTAFYEVLTTMTTGALVAAILFLLLLPAGDAPIDWTAFWGLFRLETPATALLDRRIFVLFALIMAVVIGILAWPPVINRLAGRVAQPFREKDAPPLPRFRLAFLGEGMLVTACGWFVLGASLWAMLQAVLETPPEPTIGAWGLLTAFMGASYVAGFIILIVPSGLGVREFFLVLFLVDPGAGRPRASILLAVLLLRLVWTAAELIVAAAVYWLPVSRKVKRD